jgi:Family of unknown function (DUF6314)
VDYRLRSYGRVDGELVVSLSGGGVVWRERGQFSYNGSSHEVSRELLIQETPDGWWVSFDDGRPFHPWRVGEAVRHLCGSDAYDGLIDVAEGRIRTVWDVTGPAKAQRLVTRFDRVWQSRDT